MVIHGAAGVNRNNTSNKNTIQGLQNTSYILLITNVYLKTNSCTQRGVRGKINIYCKFLINNSLTGHIA